MATQTRPSHGAGMARPTSLSLSFVTDGVNAPSTLRGPIESVTRLTDGGGEVFYRILVLEAAEFYEPVKTWSASVEAGVGTRFLAYIRSDANPGGDARVTGREIDVAVRNEGTGAFVNDITGPVVHVRVDFEGAPGVFSS